MTYINERIYNELNVFNIIGYAWRVYRLNCAGAMFYILIPTLLIELAQFFFEIPSLYITKPPQYLNSIMYLCPIGMLLLVTSFFLSNYFNFALYKYFFNIITNSCKDFKTIYQHTRTNLLKITRASIVITTLFISISFILFVLLIVIFIAFTIVLNLLLKNYQALQAISFFVFEFLMLFYYYVITVCSILLSLPLVILSNEDVTVKKSIMKSFYIFNRYFNKMVLFILLLSSIWYVLILYFDLPAFIFLFLDMFSEGISFSKDLSLFTLIVTSLWGMIVYLFLWPFLFSGITMLYFHFKVINDGYDLHNSLEKLKNTGDIYSQKA